MPTTSYIVTVTHPESEKDPASILEEVIGTGCDMVTYDWGGKHDISIGEEVEVA